MRRGVLLLLVATACRQAAPTVNYAGPPIATCKAARLYQPKQDTTHAELIRIVAVDATVDNTPTTEPAAIGGTGGPHVVAPPQPAPPPRKRARRGGRR